MAESIGSPRVRLTPNIYTTLLVIAFVALLLGVCYLWYRDSQLSGSMNPFKVQSTPTAMNVVHLGTTSV